MNFTSYFEVPVIVWAFIAGGIIWILDKIAKKISLGKRVIDFYIKINKTYSNNIYSEAAKLDLNYPSRINHYYLIFILCLLILIPTVTNIILAKENINDIKATKYNILHHNSQKSSSNESY